MKIKVFLEDFERRQTTWLLSHNNCVFQVSFSFGFLLRFPSGDAFLVKDHDVHACINAVKDSHHTPLTLRHAAG